MKNSKLEKKVIVDCQEPLEFEKVTTFEELREILDTFEVRSKPLSVRITKEYYGHDGGFDLIMEAYSEETDEEFNARKLKFEDKERVKQETRIFLLERQIEKLKNELEGDDEKQTN